MTAETLTEPPAAAPVTRTVRQPAAAFPADGTIAYGPWAEIVRQHAPAPTPDVDRVANAFRGWAAKEGIPLGGASIEKSFVTFGKGYRPWR
jgi:replication initiation protein RepC